MRTASTLVTVSSCAWCLATWRSVTTSTRTTSSRPSTWPPTCCKPTHISVGRHVRLAGNFPTHWVTSGCGRAGRPSGGMTRGWCSSSGATNATCSSSQPTTLETTSSGRRAATASCLVGANVCRKLQQAHWWRRQAWSAAVLLRSGACRSALVEIPLLGYPQRRPDQRLHPVGRREPPAVCKHSTFRPEGFQAEVGSWPVRPTTWPSRVPESSTAGSDRQPDHRAGHHRQRRGRGMP